MGPWLKWLGDRAPTPLAAAQYNVLLVRQPGSRANVANVRNAINAYHVSRGEAAPFSDYPYPLATKYVPLSFGEVWSHVRALNGPERAWAALQALARASAEDCLAFRYTGNPVRVGGHVVPVTDEVDGWLRGYVPPQDVTEAVAWLPRGVRITEVHLALTAELTHRGVPEITRAGLYGRWSAMKARVAVCPAGLYGVPLGRGGIQTGVGP